LLQDRHEAQRIHRSRINRHPAPVDVDTPWQAAEKRSFESFAGKIFLYVAISCRHRGIAIQSRTVFPLLGAMTRSSLSFSPVCQVTTTEQFLSEMDAVVAMGRLLALIQAHFPNAEPQADAR